MTNHPSDSPGEARTVGIFNFIRRIGFPTTLETGSALVTVTFLASVLGFPSLGLNLPETLQVATIAIVLPAILGEALVANVVLRDPILDFRRIIGLELIAWSPALLLFPLSAFLSLFGVRSSWQDVTVLAVSISFPVRALSFVSLSAATTLRKVVSLLVVPILVCSALLIEDTQFMAPMTLSMAVAGVISILGVVILVQRIETLGIKDVGASPMGLFRAFLRHWLNHDSRILENHLAPLGLDDEIRTTVLSFFQKNSKHKGSFVVSSFHPGPYRDLGSGGLSSLLKERLEHKFGGVVHVPHGISGHQSNIITTADIEKFVGTVESSFPNRPTTAIASRLERRSKGTAKASGQLFNRTALVTLTLSPENMEDMPPQLEESIRRRASSYGLSAAVVDSHNSMRKETMISESESSQLQAAAEETLDYLQSGEQSGFKAGFASDPLSSFTLEDGIGPGGLSALVVSTQGQMVAYLTVDGNNMEPGFREAILSSLRDLHIVDGEVMTTDSHLVTGLVRSPLGYYPVGAHVDKTIFLSQVRATVEKAVHDLEDVMVDVSRSKVRVRVLGKQTFQSVTQYIRRVGIRVRNLFYLLEFACALTTLLILVVL